MKKIIIYALPLFFLLTLLPLDVVTAQTTNPLGFVTCSGPDCSACNLVGMINNLIRWLFGFIFLLFSVLMVKAGFGLVTSGGSQSALDAAKSSFQNAIIGLIIVMAAWLMVDTIMRGLVGGGATGVAAGNIINGWGPWSQVQCQVQTATTAPAPAPGVPSTPSATSTAPAPTGCAGGTCVALGIPCSNSNSCSISPSMVANFQAMHTAAGVAGARVTEAMPPTRVHQNACHTNGTCIDYSKQGGMTSAEVISVINAAQANGLRPIYEVSTTAQRDALVADGVPAASVSVLGAWISAPHFSIYAAR